MAYTHALQSSRFELKYIIDEPRAAGVRDFVLSHLEVDEYAVGKPNNSYRISSIYMDTPSLTLFKQTLQGIKNRFKLRMRFYDDNPSSPVFLEIKRRVTDVICKERASLSREGVRYFLSGRRPDESYIYKGNSNGKAASALLNFCHLRDSIGALPCIYVSYMREAYVSPNSNQIRVTFDRELFGTPYDDEVGLALPADGPRPDIGGVILELKFTDRFPPWMRDLVQAFDLQRTSVPKYNNCIHTMGIRSGWNEARLGLI